MVALVGLLGELVADCCGLMLLELSKLLLLVLALFKKSVLLLRWWY